MVKLRLLTLYLSPVIYAVAVGAQWYAPFCLRICFLKATLLHELADLGFTAWVRVMEVNDSWMGRATKEAR